MANLKPTPASQNRPRVRFSPVTKKPISLSNGASAVCCAVTVHVARLGRSTNPLDSSIGRAAASLLAGHFLPRTESIVSRGLRNDRASQLAPDKFML